MDVADESLMDTSAAACDDTPAAASKETVGPVTQADSGGVTAETNTTTDSAGTGGVLSASHITSALYDALLSSRLQSKLNIVSFL